MRFLLAPVGSSGDVHPYVGLGATLAARGHDVVVLTAEPHRAVVERAGLGFAPTFPAEAYHAATLDPDLWHPRRGFGTVMRMVLTGLDQAWAALESWYLPGETFLVGHPLAFAARSFEEKYRVPSATLHLAPSSIRTAYQVPAIPPGVDLSGLPRWLKRAFWYLVDRTQVDPVIAPVFNRWRSSRGLPPAQRFFQSWLNSPQRVLGLFPEWYGARQPDWPEQFAFTSFPLWDDPHGDHVDPELAAFLAAGPPPVIATPGSANRHAGPFFAAVTAALLRLGRRGLLLTAYPEQLPANLPATILHRHYAPLSAVLPRAAALVHHGGIGTLAQGLAAGVPHLVMPMAFDQPDNALRLERLGVGRWASPARFTAERVAQALSGPLQGPAVTTAVARWRDRLRPVSGLELTAGRLEQEGRA